MFKNLIPRLEQIKKGNISTIYEDSTYEDECMDKTSLLYHITAGYNEGVQSTDRAGRSGCETTHRIPARTDPGSLG